MSLSRPARFPLLKLPWLCIESVIKNWNIVDLIFFALMSKKNRRIVKSFRILLNRIKISISETATIWLGDFSEIWNFSKPSLESLLDPDSMRTPLMLHNNPIPVYSSKMGYGLESYTDENEITALKMVMEFLNEVFKCSIETVSIQDDNFPESGDIGVKSTVNLYINGNRSQPFGYAQSQKLNLLLENLEVTGTCNFLMTNTEKDFYVDPKLFKGRKLMFGTRSAAWVTREVLMQFEVAQFKFYDYPFSVEEILLFVIQWFHSDNKKLEYLCIASRSRQISLENFLREELNPALFSGRTRVPPTDSFKEINFSKGLEIVRHDGLQATIHIGQRNFMFYIWHDQ